MPVTRDEVVWAYQLFLGRPPESEEVIGNHMNSEDTMALRRTFMQSPEFGSRLAEICKTVVLPAPSVGNGIDEGAVLKALHSDEFPFLSRELVKQIYIGLLKREPDEEGLTAYSEGLREPQDVARIIEDVLNSSEFAARYSDAHDHPDPDENYDKPCMVFIHIRKTAGTSIQRHLHDHFPEAEYYRENEDRLHRYSPSNLSRYNLFAGHFSYDSIRYIPRSNIGIFTFVREPKSRLLSQYYFYRAYEPTNRLYSVKTELANCLSAEEFFENPDIRSSHHFWNNMCWAVMGQRKWREWQSIWTAEDDPGARADLVETMFRPEIAKRLGEFFFIGMQEDFERSVNLLFQILKLPIPNEIRTDNKLELLLKEPHFKKTLEKQPVTERLDAALDGLVQLDNLVYQEGKRLYGRRLTESDLSLRRQVRAGLHGTPRQATT